QRRAHRWPLRLAPGCPRAAAAQLMAPRSAAADGRGADLRQDTTSWGAVLALMAAGVVGAAQIGKGSAALPVLQDEFALSAAGGAWVLSNVSAVGAGAGGLL